MTQQPRNYNELQKKYDESQVDTRFVNQYIFYPNGDMEEYTEDQKYIYCFFINLLDTFELKPGETMSRDQKLMVSNFKEAMKARYGEEAVNGIFSPENI